MQNRSFNKIIIPALFALLLASPAWAQERRPVATGTPNGIWVYLGDEIPKDFRYEVYRKTGKGNPEQVGTITYQSDEKDMKARLEEYNTIFSNLDALNDKDIVRIRSFASRNTKDDTIAMKNIPVMHLVFGTAFFDKNVRPGTVYQYIVRKVTGKDNQLWQRESNTVTYPGRTEIMKPVLSNIEESGVSVLLRWYVPQQKSLNTFSVYRRVFGKEAFEKIKAVKGYNMSQDTVWLIAVDTTVQSPGFYQYYLRPFDIYGNSGPVSDTVGAGTLAGRYNPVPEYLRAKSLEKDHQVMLTWKFADKKYLRGVEVYRSQSFDKGFNRVVVLPASDTSFTDVVPVAGENYWYYLVIEGPVSTSLPTAKVSAVFSGKGEKPLPPDETGAESVKGGVKVFWTCNEPYVKGFYVYRYDYEAGEYNQVSGLIPAGSELYSYTDSINPVMGADVRRYAVRAVSDLNVFSDLSEPAEAAPGLKVTVKAPMNVRINPTGNGIMIIWDDMRSSEPNLLGYRVFRQQDSEKNYRELLNDTLRNDKNYYNDTTLVSGRSYRYFITAIDYYGNESPGSRPVYYGYASVTPASPVITRAVSTADGIMISWGQVTDNDIVSVKVYRAEAGGKSQVIATLPSDTDHYLDKSAVNGKLYTYNISLALEKGGESEISSGVSVRK